MQPSARVYFVIQTMNCSKCECDNVQHLNCNEFNEDIDKIQ